MSNGLMENAASVEIRTKRGFPPPLAKVPPKSGGTFAHFPQALLGYVTVWCFEQQSKHREGKI
jgi:hypothetical protein